MAKIQTQGSVAYTLQNLRIIIVISDKAVRTTVEIFSWCQPNQQRTSFDNLHRTRVGGHPRNVYCLPATSDLSPVACTFSVAALRRLAIYSLKTSQRGRRSSTEQDMPFLQFFMWRAYIRIREDLSSCINCKFSRYYLVDYKDDWYVQHLPSQPPMLTGKADSRS